MHSYTSIPQLEFYIIDILGHFTLWTCSYHCPTMPFALFVLIVTYIEDRTLGAFLSSVQIA